MQSKAKSFKVGVAAPEVPSFSEEQWRTLRVQLDPQYLPFRDPADLLKVLNKAKATEGVQAAVIAQLKEWATTREKIDPNCSPSALSAEEHEYYATIAPTWDSLVHRGSVDMALLILHLVDKGIVPMESDQGFCVKANSSALIS